MEKKVFDCKKSAVCQKCEIGEHPTLGDFIEDLFCNSLFDSGEKKVFYPIIRTELSQNSGNKKIVVVRKGTRVLECFPDAWIDKEEFDKAHQKIKNEQKPIDEQLAKKKEILSVQKNVLNGLIEEIDKIDTKNDDVNIILRKSTVNFKGKKINEINELEKLKTNLNKCNIHCYNVKISRLIHNFDVLKQQIEELNLEKKRKNNASIITTFNRFINSNIEDNSIASSIFQRFLFDTENTKKDMVSHISHYFIENNMVIDISMFKKYINCIMNQVVWFGTESCNVLIKEKINELIKQNRVEEIIAMIYLSAICLNRVELIVEKNKFIYSIKRLEAKELNRNINLYLVWFNSAEIASMNDCISIDKNVYPSFRYSYAKYFYEHKLYDLSFIAIEEIKSGNNDIPKMLAEDIYVQHLLLGRGCNRDLGEALSIITKSREKTEMVDPETIKQSWQKKENERKNAMIKDTEEKFDRVKENICSGYYGKVNEFSPKLVEKHVENDAFNVLDYLPNYKDETVLKSFESSQLTFDTPCCVVNSKSKEVLSFVKGLTDYRLVDFYDENDLGTAVFAAQKRKVIFLLFSENEDKNINDCLCLINRLFETETFEKISKNIDIYLKANFGYASMLIDSTLNMKKGLLRIHVCDYNKLVAQKLLSDAPLYIPRLTGDTKTDIVVFGTNEATLQLVKETVAVAFDHSIRISVLGNKAQIYRNKLVQQSPGIYKESKHLNRIIPDFYDCDIESTDFIDLFSAPHKETNLEKIKEVLQTGTYFLVDLGNDKDNILFSTKLRGWLLSCDRMFARAPFIAVKCENGQNAEIAKNLVVNNKTAGNNFYNNYNLYFYGMKEDVFSGEYLDMEKNPKKQMALNIHLAYLEENSTVAEIESAIKNYFKFSYNRDSSECAAISLTYMFYYLGMIKKIEDLKLNNKALSEKYEKWIKDESHLKSAERYEHSRWVGYMLSRGWQSATLEQVEAYAGQESGDHKHLLCRLHPFICNWDDFSDDAEESVKINALKNGIKGLKLPDESTKKIVSAIGKILTNNPFAYKELEIDESR